jgi:hypothetical protein
MKPVRRLSCLVALSAWLLPVGCSSTGFDGRVYHGGDTTFRVGAIPQTWTPLEVEGDDALAIRDPATGTVITVSATCGRDSDDVPLEALTQHLFIQFTERQIASQEKFQLDGREALKTELTAKLDGVKRRFRVVVLKKNRCVYDFTEIVVEGRSTASSDRTFSEIVNGFATVKK